MFAIDAGCLRRDESDGQQGRQE
eukprot:COSAG04_NODE_3208_length_3047_cov_70.556309_6_plen_22_part_01